MGELEMTIAFFDSWEDGTFDKWLTIAGIPFIIITNPVRCGEKAIRSNLTSGEIYHTLNATPDIQRFKFFFKIIPNPDEPPTGAGAGSLFSVEFTDNTFVQLYVVTGVLAKPILRIQTDFGANFCTGTTQLNSNQWYCIEIRLETNKNGATETLYIDGVLECSFVVDLPARNFYRAYFDPMQWTFGRDCRSAIDCYCYEDSDTEIGCTCVCCGHASGPADVTIGNDGGELTFEPIRWIERQTCNPTIQDVPTRSDGQRIDTDVWVLKTRELRMRLRLTDTEKATLLGMSYSNTMYTITADSDDDGAIEWTYTAWLRSKKIVWDYREFGRCDEIDTRPWRADLVFDVESFSLDEYECPSGAGTVKLNDHVLDGGIDCDKLSYITDTEFTEVKTVHLPDWVTQIAEVDEGHYNRSVFEITYVIRATDDLKYCLDLILQGHASTVLEDSRYMISGTVWIIELEATWAGEKNWANPWKVQITLIADYNDLTIEEFGAGSP